MSNKKNHKNKKVQKNKRILVQVGGLIVFVFALGILLISTIFSLTNMYTFLHEKTSNIRTDITETAETIKLFGNKMIYDYWRDNSQTILDNVDNVKKIDDETRMEIITYDYGRFNELDEEDKLLYATLLYITVNNMLKDLMEQYRLDYSRAFIFDIDSKDRGIIYFDYSDDKDAQNSKLGDRWSVSILQHYAVRNIIIGNETAFEVWRDPKHDNTYYVGCISLFPEDGNDIVFCLAYDWSYMSSTIYNATLKMLGFLLVFSLIITGGIILIFLRRKVLIPLTNVKIGLQKYMENKDSREVTEEMSKIKARNEIGILADDITGLAHEMDRYVEDNIKLAGERERVLAELEFAAKIQKDALLNDFNLTDKVEISALMTPAKEVGGDFYDMFMIDDDHIGFCIADVSGKGVPASLLMMSTMTSIRSFALSGINPGAVLENVNNNLVSRQVSNMFVTVWIGILDLKTGILTTANAGHEDPLINTTGEYVSFKEKHGLVVGGYANMKYKETQYKLEPGDRVFVFTDGASEATSADVELYGVDRVLASVNKNKDLSPEALIHKVKEDIDEFVGEAEQFDDITMVCFEYHG